MKIYQGKRFTVNTYFKWYDLWVGVFVDTKKKILYICPLPTWVIEIGAAKRHDVYVCLTCQQLYTLEKFTWEFTTLDAECPSCLKSGHTVYGMFCPSHHREH